MRAGVKALTNRTETYFAQGAKHGFFNGSPWLERTLRRADQFLASLGYLSGPPSFQAL